MINIVLLFVLTISLFKIIAIMLKMQILD